MARGRLVFNQSARSAAIVGKGSKAKKKVPLPTAVAPTAMEAERARAKRARKKMGSEAVKMGKDVRHYDRDRKGRFS